MEGTIAEIRMFAGNFAPKYWMLCQGQILPINQYQALFSLLGTAYGGNGTTNFALPDLRSRVPVGAGTYPGVPPVQLGQMAGTETVTMTTETMPPHAHALQGTVNVGSDAVLNDPTGAYLGNGGAQMYSTAGQPPQSMAPNSVAVSVANTGNSVPFSILQPVLGMNYVICIFGVYPSRN